MTAYGPPSELIDRARGGDPRALERLITVCRPDLERYARRHCESDDVEEAVQDALWILYRRLGGLRSAAAFAGWLFQIVRRACLGYSRQRRRRPSISLDELPIGSEHDNGAINAELRTQLITIIAALPPAYREVLVLKDVQGLSADELSGVLGITPEGCKSRLHRARAAVRAALSELDKNEREGVAA